MGFNPFGFHLTSVLIHIVNALILYVIVLGLSASLGLAFFTALIFSVHPLLSESVNYISSRSDILLGLFLLLSLFFYARIQGRLLRSRYFYISIICFVAALLSKESALVFPLFLLVYAIVLDKGKKNNLAYFLVSLIYILVRVVVSFKFKYVGHYFPVFSLALTDIKVIAQYASLIFYPFSLHKNWLLPLVTSLKDSGFILSFLACAGMVILAIRWFKKNKLFSFGLFWFFIFIIPSLNIILLPLLNIPPALGKAIISEAWAYLAVMGMILAVCSFLLKAAVYRNAKLIVYIVLILVACFFSGLTVKRNELWAGNPVNFYKDLLWYHPANASIHYNLANAYFQQDLCGEAIKEYQTVVFLNPAHLYARNNLCNAYVKCSKFDQAVSACEELIKINPYIFKAYYNLGAAYFNQGEYAKAIVAYEKAVTLRPDFKEAAEALELVKQKIKSGEKGRREKD